MEALEKDRLILLEGMTSDPTWLLEQEGFDASLERDLEALFTLANGYLGIRGSLSVPIPSSETDAFVAGIYDCKRPATPYSELEFLDPGGRSDPYAEIVSFPSPFELEIGVEGRMLTPENGENEEFVRQLDLKNANLRERMKWKLPGERELLFHSARAVFLEEPHLMMQEVRLRAIGGRLPIHFRMKTLGSDLATVHTHLKMEPTEVAKNMDPRLNLALLKTTNSLFRVAIGSKVWRSGELVSSDEVQFELDPGAPTILQRAIVIRTTRDCEDPAQTVSSTLNSLRRADLLEKFSRHREKWGRFWEVADIRFPECPELTGAQRFNSFQLRAAVCPDPDVGVGARALSGRAYEGHVFWDSEIFIFPFILHADPALARTQLDYRYRTLDGARRRARAMGYQGACYAWESTVTGDDVTPERLLLRTSRKSIPIFTGSQQIHVTADVVFAISKYAEATRDWKWAFREGAEIAIETARFWCSRVTRFGERFHLLKVIGPDEYHHSVDDNAYTNWMARFNLQFAAELLARVKRQEPEAWEDLVRKLGVKQEEVAYWSWLASRIFFPGPNEAGLIEQFSGYFKLRPVPLRNRQEARAPLERLFSWEKVNEEQLIKQADVLMIPFLFPDAFPLEVTEANYLYYEPRTDHGSSLSPSVHAGIAAQVGRWDDANHFWRTSLHLDLLDLMRNTSLGIHPGNMGGAWQALVHYILGHSQSSSRVREEFLKNYGPVELRLRGERVLHEIQWKTSARG